MAVAVALWSLTVTPEEPEVFVPPGDVRITNIALGEELADENGRSTIKLMYTKPMSDDSDEEDEEGEEEEKEDEDDETPRAATTVLASLTPGKIEQATLDVILEGDQEYLIEVVGKNTVYLTGNYIDQTPMDQPPYDDDMSDDEDDYDLREVSSDVEIDPEEMDIPSDDDESRFEEVNEEETAPKKDASKKRPRESDAMEADEEGEEKLSKTQRKKLSKKLKAEGGKAVPAEAEAKPEAKANGAPAKDEKKGKDAKKKDEGKAELRELQGGVKVKDHKVGTGPQAKKGDTVSMRYVGKLTNQSGKVFDKNTKGAPFKFHLGKGEVIKGWDVGIAGMQVGGERLLIIPPAMAYGKQAQGGIPANSTLCFEVKLLKIN
ncbi:hypothetical protein OBBRIDRAFT_761840 [Obba rivulosa]|uniref:FK506-binding protein n=1 Tax=Obba rivulosa TaxID=1052685 RepID=A0A8E2AMP2_9APHY|nr:hypothetical protein OBBRIDRAFT_761840 [Obba rivulosa]